MPRTVLIPAACLPGSPASPGRAELALTLVDAADQPVPVSDQDNLALLVGTHRYALGTAPLVITVATQDELHGETFYRVEILSGPARWVRRVQVPSASQLDLTWAEFIGLDAPMAPRLLPDPGGLEDGLWITTVGHAWATTRTLPSGIAEAPETGGPYGRQSAGWVDLTEGAFATAAQGLLADTAMQPVLYDPRGVRADIFSATNLTGAIDGGTF